MAHSRVLEKVAVVFENTRYRHLLPGDLIYVDRRT